MDIAGVGILKGFLGGIESAPRRLRSQRVAVNRIGVRQELVDRIVSQAMGIVTIGIATCDPLGTLAEQSAQLAQYSFRITIITMHDANC